MYVQIVQHTFFAGGSKLKAAPQVLALTRGSAYSYSYSLVFPQVETHRKVKRLLEDVSKGTGKPAEMITTLQDQDSPKTKALDRGVSMLARWRVSAC